MNSRTYYSILDARNLLSEVDQLFSGGDRHSEIVKQVSIAINAIDNLFRDQQYDTSTKR